MKELICIICPRGCHLTVDETTLEVGGNACDRGITYGRSEVTSPMRTVTGSVAVEGGLHNRLSVRTDREIPKAKMFEIMDAIHAVTVKAPVKIGDVIIENVCGTGANVIATRDM